MRKPGAAMRNNTSGAAPAAKPPGANPNAVSGSLPKAANPNAVSGSLPKAANPNATSGVQPAPKIGGRPPSGKAPPSDLAARREALGLSSMKPSEMIAGLNEAADRAEKLEKREEAKRKGGGNTLNTALHVDDTGKKWSRMVLMSLLGVVALVVLIGGAMIYFSNHKSLSPAEGNQVTRQWVRDLGLIAQQMKAFDPDEKPSLDKVKERLTSAVNAQIDEVKSRIKAQEDVHRPPSSRDVEEKDELLALLKFQDAWGQPFQFNLEDDKLTISARGKSESGRSIDPVVVKLRHNKPSK